MTNTSWLPKFLRWMFTVFVIFTALCAVAVLVVMLIDPTLPPGAHFGPIKTNFLGQPGSMFFFRDSAFALTAFRGGLAVSIRNAGGLIEMLKHFGLPLIPLRIVFFIVVFELLRRLFRNVGRGESFTQPTLRLVQILGVSLLVYSLVSAFVEVWFVHAMYSYVAQNALITISGSPVHLPLHLSQSHGMQITIGNDFPFGTPIFFSGLLVLALSEVFRQGLVLKRENDLTV
jgi:hypothetical protein